MDINQKEKLEQELAFLKESFESEVITKEEYEKGKERTERKLREVSSSDPESKQEAEEPKKDSAEEIRDKESEKIEPAKNKKSKKFALTISIAILAIIIFFLFLPQTKNIEKIPQNNQDTNLIESKAKFRYLILSSDECFNCNIERVRAILENWFPDFIATEVDIKSAEGIKIADELNLNILPAYIFESNISEIDKFNELRQVFEQKGNLYVLGQDAAGATYYFRRENINNRLDLFILQGELSSMRAKKSAEEFIEATEGKVELNIHITDDDLAKELGIKNTPTFLINNRIKFTGVHPPEIVKQNFCKLNAGLEACNKTLALNII